MTEEKRRQMQELRKQAIALEIRGYGMAKASRSATTLDDKAWATSDTDSNMTSKVSKISSNNSFGSQKSNCSASSQDIMIEIPRRSKLQQTKTYIYDSTQQPQLAQQLLEPPQRSRPQTLSIGSNHVLVPTICVNPPTPLCENKQSPKPPPCPDLCPTVESLCHRKLTVARRKLNNITNRIMLFEQTGNNDQLCDEPVELLWQNQEIHKPLVDKRMIQRSSTSPALHAGQTSEDQQMQRSRSFTLEQPSQALVEHMQRVANETSTSTDTSTPTPSISLNRAPSLSSIPTSSPPPLPPLPAQAVVEASAMTGSPRCHFALPVSPSCSSDQSLQHLRRDTIESKAKQVHRSSSGQSVELCKSVTTSGRRSGGHTPGRLQQQQQQIKELLERALHETKDVMEEQNVEKRRQLAVAKQKMLKDIKSAHRDRFQQLVQYQHEEQRRMQAEFDRQQKLLIEQICADINVSAYAHDQMIAAGGEVIPNGKSEYTSTDDLPSLLEVSVARSAELQSEEELQVNESAGSTARKRLFDEKGEHDGFHDVSMESLASSSSPRNRVRKPVVRSQTKPTAANRLNRSQTSASSNSPPVRRVANSNKFASSPSKSNPKSNVVSKPRRSISPSRQMVSDPASHGILTYLTNTLSLSLAPPALFVSIALAVSLFLSLPVTAFCGQKIIRLKNNEKRY